MYATNKKNPIDLSKGDTVMSDTPVSIDGPKLLSLGKKKSKSKVTTKLKTKGRK